MLLSYYSLSFSIVTDHPSVINKMKKETEDQLYKFFAGCGMDVTKYFEEIVTETIEETQIVEVTTLEKIEEEAPIQETKPQPESTVRKEPPYLEIECYFRNARRSKTDPTTGLRVGEGRDISVEITTPSPAYELSGTSQPCSDTKRVLNLNQPFVDKIDQLIDFLATPDGQYYGVEFIGYTSGAAPKNYNKVLAIDRATSVYRYVTERVKNRGINGGTGYTYDERNFSVGNVGYRCNDNGTGDCLKATENSKLNIDKLNIDGPDPNNPNNIYKNRWTINAKGEDNASSKNDEDATFGNNDLNAEKAKLDRKVKIKVYKYDEYEINNTIIKLDPKKASTIETGVNSDNLEIITQAQMPTVAINPDPVTSKLGDSPTIVLTETTKTQEQKFAEAFAMSYFGNNKEPELDTSINDEFREVKSQEEIITTRTVEKTVQALFSECSYFEKIRKEDPFVYEGIVDKIKNFHPAFHSITPEGFNERLTFLNQCSRQGPSIRPSGNDAQNLAFGRPPVCVLRIGDFYYTKIIIDSIGISYDPLVWDMNPEGVGVQPMLAKIDLNFSFIGGSSIDGPIRQLQNAVSFNFFANTSVFNPRRYYTAGDNVKFETLVEKLKADANASVVTSKDYIGFGSFGSQVQADAEINQNRSVNTNVDSQNQTENVIENKSPGDDTIPPPSFSDDQLGINQIVDVQPELFSEEEIKKLDPNAIVSQTSVPRFV